VMENCGADSCARDGKLLRPRAVTLRAKDLVKILLFIAPHLQEINGFANPVIS
jgi:hypothetical protein